MEKAIRIDNGERSIKAERNESVVSDDVLIFLSIHYGNRINLTREQAMEFGSKLVELAEPNHGGLVE